jgi:hypothetical protein
MVRDLFIYLIPMTIVLGAVFVTMQPQRRTASEYYQSRGPSHHPISHRKAQTAKQYSQYRGYHPDLSQSTMTNYTSSLLWLFFSRIIIFFSLKITVGERRFVAFKDKRQTFPEIFRSVGSTPVIGVLSYHCLVKVLFRVNRAIHQRIRFLGPKYLVQKWLITEATKVPWR